MSRLSPLASIFDYDHSVLGYIFDLSPSGYIITSNNNDIRPIIAYSFENNFISEDHEWNYPLGIIRTDLRTRTQALQYMKNSIIERNNLQWESYISGDLHSISYLFDTDTYGPFIDTKWNQGDPYNIFCPIDPVTTARCPIGCVVTAMGQIVNFWEWPRSIAFNDSDSYVSDATTPPIDINAPLANMDTIDYNGNHLHPDDTTMAALLYACGVSIHMKYSDGGSMASSANVVTALKAELAYSNADGIYPTVLDFYTNIANDVISYRPSYLALYSDSVGHAIIVDGYRASGDYHVNYGWGGSADGWYYIPDSLPAGFTTASQAIVNIIPPVITHKPVLNFYTNSEYDAKVACWWDDPIGITEDVSHFNVYRKVNPTDDFEFVQSTGYHGLTDSTADELTDYIYAVGAVYASSGESALREAEVYSGIYNGWTHMLERIGNEQPYAIANVGDGGVISAGYSESLDGINSDIYIARTDDLGNIIWTTSIVSESYQKATDIINIGDSLFMICGDSRLNDTDDADILLAQIDSNADTIWTNEIGGIADESAVAIRQTDDGGYIIAGKYIESDDKGIYLLKISSEGDSLWANKYGTTLDPSDMILSTTDDILIAGTMEDGSLGNDDFFLAKFNSLGDSLWIKNYGGSNMDQANSLCETSSGYLLAGDTRSFGIPMFTSILLVNLDFDGDTLWTTYYGGMQNYTVNKISHTLGDGFIAVGSQKISGNTGLYLLYLDESGDTLKTHQYSTTSTDIGYYVTQLPDSGIAIAGKTFLYGDNDLWLMKIGGYYTTSIQENDSKQALPNEMKMISAYPNPFNSAVTIEVDGASEIEIYDMNGRKVELLRSQNGTFYWIPDANINTGVYLVRSIDNLYSGKKLLYLK